MKVAVGAAKFPHGRNWVSGIHPEAIIVPVVAMVRTKKSGVGEDDALPAQVITVCMACAKGETLLLIEFSDLWADASHLPLETCSCGNVVDSCSLHDVDFVVFVDNGKSLHNAVPPAARAIFEDSVVAAEELDDSPPKVISNTVVSAVSADCSAVAEPDACDCGVVNVDASSGKLARYLA